MNNFSKNYLSTSFFLFSTYFFYSHINFYQNFLIKNLYIKYLDININSLIIFKIIIGLYLILLIPFYLNKNKKFKSKARIIIEYIIKKNKNIEYKIKNEEQLSILSWLVKVFFAPLMIIWLTGHIITTSNNIYFTINNINNFSNFYNFFNNNLFYLLLGLILFFDVLFFSLGYLIESKKTNNIIKSVDTNIIGWLVVLICYPPFNSYLTDIIGWYSQNFPHFNNEYIHIFLNILILLLMGIYSWASISLGLKASNLTNRGIISTGPYKYVRHPAYITKNITWWIGGLPLLISNFGRGNYKMFFIILISLIIWTFIYYLRAITEENHLNKDKDYIKYKNKVKYKFIPKVF